MLQSVSQIRIVHSGGARLGRCSSISCSSPCIFLLSFFPFLPPLITGGAWGLTPEKFLHLIMHIAYMHYKKLSKSQFDHLPSLGARGL